MWYFFSALKSPGENQKLFPQQITRQPEMRFEWKYEINMEKYVPDEREKKCQRLESSKMLEWHACIQRFNHDCDFERSPIHSPIFLPLSNTLYALFSQFTMIWAQITICYMLDSELDLHFFVLVRICYVLIFDLLDIAHFFLLTSFFVATLPIITFRNCLTNMLTQQQHQQ